MRIAEKQFEHMTSHQMKLWYYIELLIFLKA